MTKVKQFGMKLIVIVIMNFGTEIVQFEVATRYLQILSHLINILDCTIEE